MKPRTRNDLELGPDGVWTLPVPHEFGYSEGSRIERFLARTFEGARDLSTTSTELEARIRDWPSLYHLSRARSNLLRPFEVDASARVLEVGCGCGAITRFLGETFSSVVSVEGSPARAALARLRTRDLDNVEIVCAPFQELQLEERFDVVFCVGVLEYASLYGGDEDPHRSLLRRMRGLVAEGGALVLAIENQFGLKYFAAVPEDHTGIAYDGIEGYPRFADRARTFGRGELLRLVGEHFATVEEYFPFPDYKLPQCVVSRRGLDLLGAGELIGAFCEGPNDSGRRPFDQPLALLELERNGAIDFFANSFLLVAGDGEEMPVRMPALATLYSKRRPPETHTVTRVCEAPDGELRVEKALASGASAARAGRLTLRGTGGPWIARPSLDTLLRRRVRRRGAELDEVFAPCRAWLDALAAADGLGGQGGPGGGEWVDGALLDCIWRNAYPRAEGCDFIDQEWSWDGPVRRNALLLRSVHWFLEGVRGTGDLHPRVARASTRALALEVAALLGLRLRPEDFAQFIEIEAEFARVNVGVAASRARTTLRMKTRMPGAYAALSAGKRLWGRARSRLRRLPLLAGREG